MCDWIRGVCMERLSNFRALHLHCRVPLASRSSSAASEISSRTTPMDTWEQPWASLCSPLWLGVRRNRSEVARRCGLVRRSRALVCACVCVLPHRGPVGPAVSGSKPGAGAAPCARAHERLVRSPCTRRRMGRTASRRPHTQRRAGASWRGDASCGPRACCRRPARAWRCDVTLPLAQARVAQVPFEQCRLSACRLSSAV